MKADILIAGVGGQGILSIAAIIALAGVEKGMYIKQSEVHGMSQRGGAVQSHLRLSDEPIYSDLISLGAADLIISVEPLELLRYLPYLAPTGWVIANKSPFKNVSNYPDEEAILMEIKKIKNHILIDADGIARSLQSVKSSNMVLAGAASPFLKMLDDEIEKAIAKLFYSKGEKIISTNLQAFKKGVECTQNVLFS